MLEHNSITAHSPSRATILPGDRVLIYDRDQYRWHKVEDVLIGVRTRIRIAGVPSYFDQALVASHMRAVRR
jgi:hypothetical protein